MCMPERTDYGYAASNVVTTIKSHLKSLVQGLENPRFLSRFEDFLQLEILQSFGSLIK